MREQRKFGKFTAEQSTEIRQIYSRAEHGNSANLQQIRGRKFGKFTSEQSTEIQQIYSRSEHGNSANLQQSRARKFSKFTAEQSTGTQQRTDHGAEQVDLGGRGHGAGAPEHGAARLEEALHGRRLRLHAPPPPAPAPPHAPPRARQGRRRHPPLLGGALPGDLHSPAGGSRIQLHR
jgi:hypothetical protein